MSASNVRTTFEQVQAILHAEWDPIGGVPLDEYDSYAWPVLKLLMARAPHEEIATYLRHTANETIGCPVPEERLARVVEQLLRLPL